MKVNKTLTVSASPEKAFDAFTAGIGEWWPLETHSFGGDRHDQFTLEGQTGGRLYETFSDGTEHVIGEVVAYDRPRHVAFTWTQPSWPGSTRIDVRFTPAGQGSVNGAGSGEPVVGTQVDLTHTGWDDLGSAGEDAFASYNQGWDTVFGRHFAEYVEAVAREAGAHMAST